MKEPAVPRRPTPEAQAAQGRRKERPALHLHVPMTTSAGSVKRIKAGCGGRAPPLGAGELLCTRSLATRIGIFFASSEFYHWA